MKYTIGILKFSYPYFQKIILNTLFNLLAVIFSLFSISLIIPILGLLFGTIEPPENTVEVLKLKNIKDYLYSFIYSLLQHKGAPITLGFICALVGLGTILKNTFRYLALFSLTPIRNNVIRDIRIKMYSKILNTPIKSINKFKKGDLLSRMTNDLVEIEWSIMGCLEFFIKDPIHIIIFLSSLIYISPKLTMICLSFLPITALIITKISKSLKKTSLLSQIEMGNLMSLIEETINNIKIIKALKGYEFKKNHFNQNNESLKNINNKVLWRKDLASPMSEMLSTLVMVGIIWFGGNIVLTSNLSPDLFIGFLIIFSQIIPPAKSLTTAFYSIQKGRAAAKRVFEILDANKQEKRNLQVIRNFNSKIEFRHVNFSHSNEFHLSNINLKINKGEKVAIVGESGSGKSTLIDLLFKFYKISNGQIEIDGQNIYTNNYDHLFSLATQEVMLFNDTILNNLLIAKKDATKSELEKALEFANIDKFINNLENGYSTIIGPKGVILSGGEKQRIGIARAYLSNAPILIFDEPTSSLDTELHNDIEKKFHNLKRTLIIITHKLSSLENYDQIIVMQGGKIVENGTHKFLIKNNGLYKKLYEIETLKKK